MARADIPALIAPKAVPVAKPVAETSPKIPIKTNPGPAIYPTAPPPATMARAIPI